MLFRSRGNYAGIGYEWDEDNNIFWPKKPYASWVKDTTTASWKSPIGDAPALTEEQQSQNTAGTHMWGYSWSEDAYNADNTTGWEAVKSNDESETPTKYNWNGTAWVSE